MNRKKTIILLIVAALTALVVAIPLGWYLISPLFIDVAVDEAFPSTADEVVDIMAEPEMQQMATATMEAVMEAPAEMVEEPMPEEDMASMQILAHGEFYDIAHHGMGTATVYELADGSRVLRFENFEVLNGPDLHVYLSPQNPVPDTAGVELPNSIDLGKLKGNVGSQNYDIPADIDLSQFASVVIWCDPFRVPFNAAAMTP